MTEKIDDITILILTSRRNDNMLDQSHLIRCFWGTTVAESQALLLTSLIKQQYPQLENKIRWVKSKNFHLTLKFLGPIAEKIIEPMTEIVRNFLQNIHSLTLPYTKISCFPPKHSRLIVAHLESNDDLNLLVYGMEMIAAQFDVPVEKKIFHPHITLARFHDHFEDRIQPLKIENQFLNINQIMLYQSKPTPTGNEYIPLRIYQLSESY